MKYVDEFREAGVIKKAAEEIRRLAYPGRHYRLMEVRRAHTCHLPFWVEGSAAAEYRTGARSGLPCLRPSHGPH